MIDLMLSLGERPAGRRPATCCRSSASTAGWRCSRSAGATCGDDPTVGGLVLTLRDVTEQHELEQELKYQAFHDALTGLPNRLAVRPARRRTRSSRRAPDRPDRGRAVRRPGRLQGRQRHDGARRRRRAAGRGGRPARRRRSASRTPPRGSAATSSRCSSTTPPDAEAVDAFAERIVAAFTEPFTLSEAEVLASATVGVATSQDSARRGRAAAARRPRPVRGEGGGQAALAALPAGADQRDAAAAGDRRRRSRTPSRPPRSPSSTSRSWPWQAARSPGSSR